jgi:proteic killer suppression protein
VIRSFKNSVTESVGNGRCPKGFPADIFPVARRKLRMLDAAMSLNSLRVPPANRLEALKGDRKGQHSIRVNDQWRIVSVGPAVGLKT